MPDEGVVPDDGVVRDDGLVPDGVRAALPIIDDPARSPDPAVCPFFRRELDGLLVVPLLEPDDANRCAAVGAPRPQASHQQELVCLRAAHTDCPRYLRGGLVVSDAPAARRPVTVPRATLAALLVLVLSAGISFGFVVQRGGIDLPVVEGGATPTALAVVTTQPPAATVLPATPVPTVAPTPIATPIATPSPTPIPVPPPTPSPTPSPSPSAMPAPTNTPAATPISTRYAVLKPCLDRKDCWIYRVRSGDNLFSIANYFGHSLSTIYRWNPRYPETRLRAGDPIRMPPPTR